MQLNSKYYSARCSPRIRRTELPHVTIQCPVYKEGLAAVISPTVKSIKQAMSTYELQGGSANMFINDDGLQIISDEDQQARRDFYADHNIGWTARPKHNSEGFTRKGKFKKASNMNYGLMLSCAAEEKLTRYTRTATWTQADEEEAYNICMKQVLQDNPRAWSEGNIRIGDYVLLIDSDTQVPSDCLLDAVSEMEQSPERRHHAILLRRDAGCAYLLREWHHLLHQPHLHRYQIHRSQRRRRPFRRPQRPPPLVRHPTGQLHRRRRLRKILVRIPRLRRLRHVPPLQCDGYIIRLAAWAGAGFKEGVSLTVYDELARWEKYAYGCNELLFHPIRKWIYKGPFTELFRRFLFSNIRFTSKITIISYIGTYYAIGAAWIMTLANYFAVGWFNGYLDKYYIDSWKVWFSIVIVFNGLGNISLAIMRYRIGERSFFGALLENFKWIFLLSIFLGGLSLHVSQALLAHMFEVDMTWGATSKEAERSNFFIEVPKVVKRFKFSITFAVVGILGMVVLAKGSFVPWDWRIKDFIAILPMSTVCASHLLLPIVLNPALMTFTF